MLGNPMFIFPLLVALAVANVRVGNWGLVAVTAFGAGMWLQDFTVAVFRAAT